MLRATDKGGFSAMTLYAWLAVGVGIAAMSTLLSVMYGFEGTLKERVLTAYPHVLIRSKTPRQTLKDYEYWSPKIAEVAGVERSVPFLDGEMVLEAPTRTLGAVIWGVPRSEIDRLSEKLVSGKTLSDSAQLPQMIIGSELAYRTGVDVSVHVKLISPLLKTGPMGAVPVAETFEVSGLFSSGHYDFDQQYAYVLLEDAQALLRKPKQIAGWHVWAKDADDADRVAEGIRKLAPSDWEVETWKVFNSALFQSLKLEQFAMFLVLSFAIIIAVMNVTITLLMNVHHKKKNIGVLRALGASASHIRRIFLWEGFFLGGVGLLIGAVLTVLLLVYIKFFMTFQLPAIYYDRTIPVEIRPFSLFLIYAVAVVLIIVATIYPAKRAAKLDPVKAIRE